jgi:uncharacterized membrane protein YczE
MTGLVKRTGGSVRVIRTSIEVVVLGVGWLLGGTVGVGTVLYALAIGPIVHRMMPIFAIPEEDVATAEALAVANCAPQPR